MKIKRTVLLVGLLAGGSTPTVLAQDDPAITPSGQLTSGVVPRDSPPGNLVIRPTGQMRIQLNVPTDREVDQVTRVTSGRIEIAPLVTVPGLLGQFSLNHMTLNFADFDIDRSPFGLHQFRAVGVHLRGPVSFVAPEHPARVYRFTIPPDEVTVYGATMVEGFRGGRHDGEERPSQPVTGKIDLNTRTFQAQVVIMKQKSFLGITVGGPLTITLSGSFIYGLEPLPPLPGLGLEAGTGGR
jgi:hypothetical protein